VAIERVRSAGPALYTTDTVKIAVLDAFPLVTGDNDNPGAMALEALGLGAGQFENFVSPPDDHSAQCAEQACDGKLTALYDISSHGLFVASILRDIAPNAELKIFRVVSDLGAGDMVWLAKAINAALAWAGGGKLILNMSLGFGPPLALVKPLLEHVTQVFDSRATWNELVDEYRPPRLPNAAERVVEKIVGHRKPATQSALVGLMRGEDPLVTRDGAGAYRLSGPLAGLERIFTLRDVPNVLAVAATGNDSCSGHEPHAPRVPAAVEGVLGVSSFRPGRSIGDRLHGEWEREDYANDDDLFPDNDGVGAWGGALKPGGEGSAADENSPVGLYQQEDGTVVPMHWSGTSFATPVVAGFAAALWAEADFPTGAALRAAIVQERDQATRPTPGRESLNFRQRRDA